jgi:hypothetical protein
MTLLEETKMNRLREEIPYSAYAAASAACKAMNGDRSTVLPEPDPLARVDYLRRERRVDHDDDVVVMTIN